MPASSHTVIVFPSPGAIWQNNVCHMAKRAAPGELSGILRTLGGARILRARSLGQLRRRLRAGLPYAALAALASGFSITAEDVVSILRVPPRTLARRKKERRFSAEESDRIFRVGRIATRAEEALGSREKAAVWLKTRNRALGRATPLSRLDTDLGATEVEDVILRLEHGVAS
jgi:putative toxin-antitoxin system antitoxin component (TIGR02293 family)